MTVAIPKKNILDLLLAIFRRERAVLASVGIEKIFEKYGQHAYIRGKREGFWKALLKK